MKRTGFVIVIGMVFLFMFSMTVLSLTAPPEARFTFAALPSPIVYDVPFSVEVHVDSGETNFIDYDITIQSSMSRADFSSAQLSRVDSFQLVGSLSGPQSDQNDQSSSSYRIRTETNGNVLSTSSPQRLLSLNRVVIREERDNDETVFSLAPASASARRSITAAQSGVEFIIAAQNSQSISPALSSCGDGVVGYIDTDADGIFDNNKDGTLQENEEVQEACDDANSVGSARVNGYVANKDGCSADCRVVDIGYSCERTNFGDRRSSCQKLDPREFFIAKVSALVRGQCYPDCSHPAALYRTQSNQPVIRYDMQDPTNPKLTFAQKYQMIGLLAGELSEFFADVISGGQAAEPESEPEV